MDNLARDLFLKLHEDRVVKLFEDVSRVDLLIAYKYLPNLLHLYGGDVKWEIDAAIKKEIEAK